MGWHEYIGQKGLVIAMDHFGASAPGSDLYQRFGFDPALIAEKILDSLGSV